MNYIDSAAEAADVAKGGLNPQCTLPSWSNRRATSLQILQDRLIATPVQLQSPMPTASTRILYARFRFFAPAAARCASLSSSELVTGIIGVPPKLAPNGTPFPLSRQIVKQFSSSSSPPYKKRIKDERTGSVKSERKTGLSSMTSDSRNRCRIVAAPRSRESILTERKFPRAEVAVWVLSKIRNFRISTSRFNVR